MDKIIHVRGGKTGKEIHLASSPDGKRWSSSTDCGIWLKQSVVCFKTEFHITCEKCLEIIKKRGIDNE